MSKSIMRVFENEQYLGDITIDPTKKISLTKDGRNIKDLNGIKVDLIIDDMMPDSWGNAMISRTLASSENLRKRINKTYGLNVLDKIRITRDQTRQGSLRFKELDDDNYIYTESEYDIPDLRDVDWEELALNTRNYENGNISEKNLEEEQVHVGSIGGARPKMSVINESGNLAVLKFLPAVHDTVGSPSGEALSIELARECDINVPNFTFYRGESIDAICIERFDRVNDKRVRYASLYSALESSEKYKKSHTAMNTNAQIISKNKNIVFDGEEFFKRCAFNIIINNTDDHLGNTGFLYNTNNKKWELSPQFDSVPDTDLANMSRIPVFHKASGFSSLKRRNLEDLLSVSSDFGIEVAKSAEIIKNILQTFEERYLDLIVKYIRPLDRPLYESLIVTQLGQNGGGSS